MKHNNIITHLTKAALCVPFLLTGSLSAATIIWNTDDGNYGTGSNWSGGNVPGASDEVQFTKVEGLSDSITVNVDGTFSADLFRYATGMNITMNMADGSSHSTSGIFSAGFLTGVSNAPSSLTVYGPSTGSAEFNIYQYQSGNRGVKEGVGGTTTTFSGAGLTVNMGQQITHGRYGWDNTLVFEDGVTLNSSHNIWISNPQSGATYGGKNNSMVIRGEGTTVNHFSTTNVNAFRLAGRTNSGAGEFGNSVIIEDGAVYNFDGAEGSSAALFSVADTNEERRNNYLLVTGTGSELNIGSNASLQVGRHNISNNYDNYIRVEDGGTITSEGAVKVYGQTRANRLEIGNGGTLTVNNTIEVNQGIFRLENGGILNGNATVEVGGVRTSRFEVAGSGLASTVEVNINDKGVFAVGIDGATEASTATITSSVNLYGGSTLELTIFGRNSIDSIELGIGGQLSIEPDLFGDGVVLSILTDGYTLAAGDTFTLFTGETQNIAGEFANMVLPTLTGDLEWDLTAFNEAGGWTVAVIPEPGTYAMFAGAGALLLVFLRRRKA